MPRRNVTAKKLRVMQNDPSEIIDVVGVDTFSKMTTAEIRRLDTDRKKGIDITKSPILADISTRCARFKQNINKITNVDPFANRQDEHEVLYDPTDSKKRKRKIDDVTLNVHPGNVNVFDLQPRAKRSVRDEKQRKADEKAQRSVTTRNKRKSPATSSRQTKRTPIAKKARGLKLKRPVFDADVMEFVEDLGSDDSEYDSDDDMMYNDNSDDVVIVNDFDDYVEDGFVVNDRQTKRRRYNSNNTDVQEGLDAELNDLYDDVILNTEGMSKAEISDLQKRMKELRENCMNARVTIDMVIKANFSNDDSMWFYRNIRERLPQMDGDEKFKLEDKIEKRFRFLKSLQEANMYESFSKGGDRDVMKEIMASKLSEQVKTVLLNRMCNVTYESLEEYQKALNWMDTVLSIPTEVKSSKNNIQQVLNTLHNKLKSSLYGMDSVILEILQAVCSILTDPDSKGSILTLVGPPGVGKTSISSMISESIGMGFGQVSCGSINDQATITGHGSTYIGSKPGVFTQYLIKNQQLDNVILLDELDKLHDSKIVPILLHVLDKSQNSRFHDAFCPEIDIDLSKNLYVVAVNSIDNLDKALVDRLKIVNVSGYDVETKTHISLRHILPKLNMRTGLNLSIDENTIRRCIKTVSPYVSGVRDIERFFSDIYEKILLTKHMGHELFDLPRSLKVSGIKKIDSKMIEQYTGVKLVNN